MSRTVRHAAGAPLAPPAIPTAAPEPRRPPQQPLAAAPRPEAVARMASEDRGSPAALRRSATAQKAAEEAEALSAAMEAERVAVRRQVASTSSFGARATRGAGGEEDPLVKMLQSQARALAASACPCG